MKIISWNVNSVRARIENILSYIKDSNPDILFLQEIKTQNEIFLQKLLEKMVIIPMCLVKKVIMV